MSGVQAVPLADAQATQVLAAVRQRLQLVLTSSAHVQPGQPVTAAVLPSLPEIDVSDLAHGVLNLAGVAKDVLFNTATPVEVPTPAEVTDPTALDGDELAQAAAGIFGKQPFPPPALGTLPIVPQTAGISAQLFGTLAQPNLRVGLRVRWRVRDRSGNELNEGRDFIATQGLTSPTVSLVLPPVFRELRLDTLLNPGGTVVCLSAEGTLSLGAAPPLPFTLGPVPVLLLPLLIPTVVVLFTEPGFGLTHDSAALIVVPKHSPFASAEPLFKTLRRTEAAVSALRGLGGLAAFFLGLDELLGTVPDQPRLRFAAANEIPELQRITIKRRPWYQFLGSDPNFDDKVFSLMVFGLPGTKIQFFNDEFFKMRPVTGQGNFDVELRNSPPDLDFVVTIRTLDTDDDFAPETFPPDRVPRFESDTGGDDRWHTDMSSIRFHQDWLRLVEEEVANPLPTPELNCLPRPTPTPTTMA
jgi:hypothetical protein